MSQKLHELNLLLFSAMEEMANEYEIIRRRATEDPGTAGDQGEENWAALLRKWLPPSYRVVTKGRLLNAAGVAGPQVDVLVLHPAYPQGLERYKLYFADLVLAAFECKLTLRAQHVRDAVACACEVKKLLPPREGTPYRELYHLPLVGLLAQSHCWKESPAVTIHGLLDESDETVASHPREMLDLVCIADLGVWTAYKGPGISMVGRPDGKLMIETTADGLCKSDVSAGYVFYMARSRPDPNRWGYSSLGKLIAELIYRLAWEESSLRGLARYFLHVQGMGGSAGTLRSWPSNAFSGDVRKELDSGMYPRRNNDFWDEWWVDRI